MVYMDSVAFKEARERISSYRTEAELNTFEAEQLLYDHVWVADTIIFLERLLPVRENQNEVKAYIDELNVLYKHQHALLSHFDPEGATTERNAFLILNVFHFRGKSNEAKTFPGISSRGFYRGMEAIISKSKTFSKKPLIPYKETPIRGKELALLRQVRNLKLQELANIIGEPAWFVEEIEKRHWYLSGKMMAHIVQYLGMRENHFEQLRNIVAGEEDNFYEDRYIPYRVRRYVELRDGNQCVKCGEKNNLHCHHILEYSRGGGHSVNNLVTLCVDCHAEVHEDNRAYYMIKALADK